MKKTAVFPLVVLAGGGGAFALRLLQNRSGFEVSTGLPIPGNPYAVALLWLLAGLAVGLFCLTGLLAKREEPLPFAAAFSTAGAGIPTLLVMGDFLLIISGALSLYSGVIMGSLLPAESQGYGLDAGTATHAGLELLLGLLAILAAACLLPAIVRCRRHSARATINGNLLLAPVACLAVRLALTFRADSINPTLLAYYPELLALVVSTLSFYHLAAFAFGAGKTRRFAFWSGLSVVLCAATLADRHDFSALALYAACALLQFGFLLLRLNGASAPVSAGSRPADVPAEPGDAPGAS